MSYQSIPTQTEDNASAGNEKGLFVLGVRQDGEASPVSASGDYHGFIFNEYGRLKVASAPAQNTPMDGAVSAIQATINTPVANATAFANVTQISNVMAYVTGTFSAMTCAFEGSLDSTNGTDGNWFSIQAVRSNANTVETTTGSLSAAPTYAWELSVNALAYVRVRCTARTSGTQNWRFTLGTYATEPIPASQTHSVSQSGTWTVMPGNTANTTAWLANPLTPAVSLSGDTGAKTATGNGATLTNAVSKGAHVIINMGAVTGTTPTCVIKIQGSADSGTTWFDVNGATTATLTASGAYGIIVYPGLANIAGTTTPGTAAQTNATLPRTWRIVWTIGGTTPSFTITNVQISYII